MKTNLTYLEHFHLKYNPFPMAPDARDFYVSQGINQTITEIVHGVETRKGFMILVGEVGLGKTTIGRRIVGMLNRRGIESSLILHTGYQGAELLKEINRDFGITARGNGIADQLRALSAFVLKKYSEGKNCAIIIDDAQNLSLESLELIRMLSNFETNRNKLVQVLLIGQPELLKILSIPELRQLESRIVIRQEVRPLNRREQRDYVNFKLNAAGNDGTTTITNWGFRTLYSATRGNFRRINALMDRCLYAGYVYETTRITRRIVKKALLDLQGKPLEVYKRPFPWMLAGALSLLLVLGLGKIEKHVDPLWSPTPQSYAIKPLETSIPIQVLDFLNGYGLSSYGKGFFEGLRKGNLKPISERISEETGFRLVELRSLPGFIKGRFRVLRFPLYEKKQKRFFLFWKPRLWINRFYYGYQGAEILEIERILGHLKYYNDSLDGIVGKNLMKAVVKFQENMSLPITGYPDLSTLFLMCNLWENRVYGDRSKTKKTSG